MVLAIKEIKTSLPERFGMNFHNFEDGKDVNIGWGGDQKIETNTWVPYQSPGLFTGIFIGVKQIRIQIKNELENFRVEAEFYLWDDNYKLMCSTPSSISPILTVSGDRDIGISINVIGVQAYLL